MPAPTPNNAGPTYTAASIAAGCTSLLALVAMAGCTAALVFSDGSSEPVPAESVPVHEEEVLDEWTEQIFGMTWDNMDTDQREALCVEVEHFGPEGAAALITDQMDDSSDVDEHTLVEILTDHCA